MATKANRRSVKSLLSDRHSHLNLAILSSVFIFLPFCFAAIIALYTLSNGVMTRLDSGAPSAEVMEYAGSFTAKASLLLVGNFLLFTVVGAYLALKVTHQVVGPLKKLEDQMDAIVKGDYTRRSTLRKNDYLAPLGKRLNELSAKLEAGVK